MSPRFRQLADEAVVLTKKFRAGYGESAFTQWTDFPVDEGVRCKVEEALSRCQGTELILGRIDSDGRLLGEFGPLPGFESVTESAFSVRDRYALEVVLCNGCVLIKKHFSGDEARFVREWHHLASLSGRANVPSIYKGEEGGRLYKNLITGHTVRDILVEAGARILHIHTANDPELARMSPGQRLRSVWERGRPVARRCFAPQFFQRLVEQVSLMHRAGVAGFSLTYGNVITDSCRTTPWFIDFEGAVSRRCSSRWRFLLMRYRDCAKVARLYGESEPGCVRRVLQFGEA